MKSVNSITFSADLNILYLIDNGRALAFPLEKWGVQVALVNKQLSVVTTVDEVELPSLDIGSLPTDPDVAGISGRSGIKSLKRPDGGLEIRLKVDPRDQYTSIYNPDSGVLGIIGSTDIISTLVEPDRVEPPTATCQQYLFDLRREIVLIRKVGSVLSLQSQPFKK
jgi:hypothetical protein